MTGYLNLQGASPPNQEIDLTKIKPLRAGEKNKNQFSKYGFRQGENELHNLKIGLFSS